MSNGFWTIKDVIEVLREGIPYVDAENLNFKHDMFFENNMNVHMLQIDTIVEIPLEKLQEFSIPPLGMHQFLLENLVHPELRWNPSITGMGQNSVMPLQTNPGDYALSSVIKNGKLSFPIKVTLHLDRLSATARAIRDSNFYSILDAALED